MITIAFQINRRAVPSHPIVCGLRGLLRHSLCVSSSPLLSFGLEVVGEFHLRASGVGVMSCAVRATLEGMVECVGDNSSTEAMERVDACSQSCYNIA